MSNLDSDTLREWCVARGSLGIAIMLHTDDVISLLDHSDRAVLEAKRLREWIDGLWSHGQISDWLYERIQSGALADDSDLHRW